MQNYVYIDYDEGASNTFRSGILLQPGDDKFYAFYQAVLPVLANTPKGFFKVEEFNAVILPAE